MPAKDEVKNIWNDNAEFWDGRMGEGNDFHKTLIEPIQLKLLNIKQGDKILDVACGNGQLARKLASLGANVTAIDFSEKFIEIAKSKGCRNIDYKVIDTTNKDDLEALLGNSYDSIVCTMAIMDMEIIDALISSLPKIMKPNAVFVFSILHPCFNSGENMLVHEQNDQDGEVKSQYFVKIRNYLIEKSYMGIGMIGQPKPQYYFHRSLSSLLSRFFNNGFVLDAFEEPAFNNREKSTSIFENVFTHIPPALVCRLRLR
jgi:2-polyprenyl-3-methyl-5-hydroxy-6-metoxy-1,4-benzoquinol methylase